MTLPLSIDLDLDDLKDWNRWWHQKHIHEGLNRCRCHDSTDFIFCNSRNMFYDNIYCL